MTPSGTDDVTKPTPPLSGLARVIARGASWTTVAQLAPLIVNIALTPYVIHSFGLSRYGIFLLASTIVVFLGTFDGGVGASVVRFSAVYAGKNDRAQTTRLVTSLFVVVVTLGAILFSILFLLAGFLVSAFHMPLPLRPEAVYLLRSMAIVLGLRQIQSVFAAQLTARQRYAWQSFVGIMSYGVYALGLFLTIRNHWELRGAAWTFIAQSVFVLVLTVPKALSFLDWHEKGFMPGAELKRFLSYAIKVQATGLTAIVSQQADTLIVARFLSVASVSIYGVGATFATQLRGVAFNVLGPMATAIAQAFGRGGEKEALTLFTTLQRRWVQIATAWCSAGLGAVYFGITSWLGSGFKTAGVVACVLTGAYALHMWTGTLTALLTAVGRPGIEARYATVAVVVNIVLTIPLVMWLGLLGTVLATGLGLVIGSIFYVGIARRRFRADLPSFFADVPIVPAAFAAATVVLLELLARPIVPNGGVGLIVCGSMAIPGLLVFVAALVGLPQGIALIREWRRARK